MSEYDETNHTESEVIDDPVSQQARPRRLCGKLVAGLEVLPPNGGLFNIPILMNGLRLQLTNSIITTIMEMMFNPLL